MGNCYALCKPSTDVTTKHGKVLQIVKMDGKILQFSSPILVRDMLVNFSSSGIGLSKEASEHLPPNYELKLGKVYYLLPCLSSVGTTSPAAADNMSSSADKEKDNGVRRIKIVITKKQLQELLAKQASVEDVVSGLERKTCNNAFDSRTSWKPKLESISEGSE